MSVSVIMTKMMTKAMKKMSDLMIYLMMIWYVRFFSSSMSWMVVMISIILSEGNPSNEKDVGLDDPSKITSSNCFLRFGRILDWARRVWYWSWWSSWRWWSWLMIEHDNCLFELWWWVWQGWCGWRMLMIIERHEFDWWWWGWLNSDDLIGGIMMTI